LKYFHFRSRDLKIREFVGGTLHDGRYLVELHLQSLMARWKAERFRSALFVWVPKAAGTSINAAMRRIGCQTLLNAGQVRTYWRNKGVVTFGHMAVHELRGKGLVSGEFLDSAYKFSIVRNPYDRAVSLFEYLKLVERIPARLSFRTFVEMVCRKEYEDIGLYNFLGNSHVNPQCAWLRSQAGWNIDEWFRVEDLDHQWPHLFGRLYGPAVSPEIPRLNTSQLRFGRYFDDRLAEMVFEHYQDDFQLFGYGKDSYAGV
jgi:hypothetical protein